MTALPPGGRRPGHRPPEPESNRFGARDVGRSLGKGISTPSPGPVDRPSRRGRQTRA